jgi:purine-nucleoside phosphorylase
MATLGDPEPRNALLAQQRIWFVPKGCVALGQLLWMDPLNDAYDPALRALAREVAKRHGLTLPGGVYAGLLGPAYETPAEVRMLRVLGADAVGMSTVLETIAARHMGARCVGISCVTNRAAGLSDTAPSHAEVEAAAAAAQVSLTRLIGGLLDGLSREAKR